MNPRSKKPRTQTLKAQTPLVYLRNSRSVASTAVTSAKLHGVVFCEGTGWTHCGVGSVPAFLLGVRHD